MRCSRSSSREDNYRSCGLPHLQEEEEKVMIEKVEDEEEEKIAEFKG